MTMQPGKGGTGQEGGPDFDPEKHEKVPEEDTPEEGEEGFVKKEAAEKYEDSKKEAKIKNAMREVEEEKEIEEIGDEYLEEQGLRASDLMKSDKTEALHAEARKINERLKMIERGELVDFITSLEEKYKNDKGFMLKAIEKNPLAVEAVGKELQGDPDIILSVLDQNPKVGGNYIDEELCRDRDFSLKAAEKNGLATLEAAPEEIRDDEEVVKRAIEENPEAFKYASERLRNNEEIVLQAFKQDPNGNWTDWILNEEITKNRGFIERAMDINPYVTFGIADRKFFKDKELLQKGIEKDGRVLRLTGFSPEEIREELQSDKELVMKAVKSDGSALGYASKELQDDKEVVMEAVKENGFALEHASEEMQNDLDVVYEAVEDKKEAIEYAGDEIKKELIE